MGVTGMRLGVLDGGAKVRPGAPPEVGDRPPPSPGMNRLDGVGAGCGGGISCIDMAAAAALLSPPSAGCEAAPPEGAPPSPGLPKGAKVDDDLDEDWGEDVDEDWGTS